MTILYIFLGVLGVLILWVIFAYNRFVTFVHRAGEAWADIDVQLKRRYDLIPNLVNTVKGYMAHEAGTLEKVTKAMQAQSVAEHGAAENMLTGALKSIFALSESYPDLKANQNFVELQRELADTENKIQAARRFYNMNVRDLNIMIDSFPPSIIAKAFSFAKREFFELGDEPIAREAVEVRF